MPVDPSVGERERLAVLMQQWPIALIANVLIAAVVAAVLATATEPPWLPVLWAALIVVVVVVRWQAVGRSSRRPGGVDPRQMLRILVIGSGVSGFVWGVGLAALFPADTLHQVFVAFVLGGMAAGAALTLSSHLPAMYAFLFPSVLPVAGRFFMEGAAVHAAMGGMLVVFCVALAMIGHNLNAYLRRSLSLQHDKDDLVGELKEVLISLEQRVEERTRLLQEANERLTVEIAERQRAERAERIARRDAEQANDAKSRFLAAASHDLRQPLQAMRLYYELIGSKLSGESAARPVLSRLGEAMDATERLLAALMDVSTLDAGTVVAHVETFPIQDVLDRLAAEMEPQAAAAGLTLRIRPSRHRVASDPVLLTRILRNLLTNALRHAGKGGVLLGCRQRGKMLRIEVWDRGPGVPLEMMEAIFEDFVRLADNRAGTCQGLGLGLAIVKRMANLLDHPVGVRSWPGKGSVFFLDVPAPAEGSGACPGLSTSCLP